MKQVFPGKIGVSLDCLGVAVLVKISYLRCAAPTSFEWAPFFLFHASGILNIFETLFEIRSPAAFEWVTLGPRGDYE